MTIKHLVIGGGGPLGLRYIGALEKLESEGFWHFEDIESIYATSIGSIIGAFICLKYEWNTLNKYIIERPWHDAFKVNAKQIFDSYYNKGLFDKKIALCHDVHDMTYIISRYRLCAIKARGGERSGSCTC